jgi:hypothetical protein
VPQYDSLLAHAGKILTETEQCLASYSFGSGEFFPTKWEELKDYGWKDVVSDEIYEKILPEFLPTAMERLNSSYFKAVQEMRICSESKRRYLESMVVVGPFPYRYFRRKTSTDGA